MITKENFSDKVGNFYAGITSFTANTDFNTLLNKNMPYLKNLTEYCLDKQYYKTHYQRMEELHQNTSAKEILMIMTSSMEMELPHSKHVLRLHVFLPLLYNKALEEQNQKSTTSDVVKLQRKASFIDGIQFDGKNIEEITNYSKGNFTEISVRTGRLKISDWVTRTISNIYHIEKHDWISHHYNILNTPNKLWKVGKLEIRNDAETVELPEEAKGITTTYAGCGTLVMHYLYPA